MSRTDLLARIRAVLDLQAAPAHRALSDCARQERELEKWRLIHTVVRQHPFRTRARLSRSDQWRAALEAVRDIRDPELIDWIVLQIEVARNIERGIQDLRPRKNGPCHDVLSEYVANRKRKALAVLRFARAAEEEGCYTVDSAFHARTCEILARHRLVDTDEDGRPIPSTEPSTRS